MLCLSKISPRYGLLAVIFNLLALSWLMVGPARADDKFVIAALGDSLTAGYGLAQDQGLVPQLQAWADGQGLGISLVNAGVSGDTTAGGLARLDWTLTPDVKALVVTLGGNDLLRGLPIEETRANLDAILGGARARGLPVLLVPMEAPMNYGPDYKTAFDAIYAELASRHGALLAPPFFAALTAISPDPAGLAAYMQADGIHPNAQGVAEIVKQLGPELARLKAAAAP